MKVLSGHLTLTDKNNIKYLIGENLMEGKIGRITYRITELGNKKYSIDKWVKDRGLIPVEGSSLRYSKYVSEIEL